MRTILLTLALFGLVLGGCSKGEEHGDGHEHQGGGVTVEVPKHYGEAVARCEELSKKIDGLIGKGELEDVHAVAGARTASQPPQGRLEDPPSRNRTRVYARPTPESPPRPSSGNWPCRPPHRRRCCQSAPAPGPRQPPRATERGIATRAPVGVLRRGCALGRADRVAVNVTDQVDVVRVRQHPRRFEPVLPKRPIPLEAPIQVARIPVLDTLHRLVHAAHRTADEEVKVRPHYAERVNFDEAEPDRAGYARQEVAIVSAA